MGFVKTPAELSRLARGRENPTFYDAEMLWVVWETSPATVTRLLPPPLQPAKRPLAIGFVANYPRTNFGVSYREAALMLEAEYDGVEASYVLALPVTDDMALIYGREQFGYPKKLADIAIYHEGPAAGGWVERHGVRYFSVQAQMNGTLNTPDAPGLLVDLFGAPGGTMVSSTYNVKHFTAPDGQGFDYPPRLVREEVEFRHRVVELGTASITLKPSDLDPWSEVEVVRVLGAVYTKGDNVMRPGTVVAELEPEAFLPYSFMKVDLQ